MLENISSPFLELPCTSTHNCKCVEMCTNRYTLVAVCSSVSIKHKKGKMISWLGTLIWTFITQRLLISGCLMR